MTVLRFYKQMTSPDVSNGTERSFTETWLVELDNPLTPQIEIENRVEYPYIYQPHSVRTNFFAVQRTLDQDLSAPNIRKLTVQWATQLPAAFLVDGQPKYPLNPLERPASIQWGTYKTTQPVLNVYSRRVSVDPNLFFKIDEGYNVNSSEVDVDKSGAVSSPKYAPTNTAGELLFLQDQTDFRLIQFSKNIRQLAPFMSKAGQYLNSDTVRIRGIVFRPHTLLASDLTVSDWLFESGIPYFQFSWNFYVDEVNYWHVRKRNVGFNERVAKYRDAQGNDVNGPVPGGTKYYVLRPIEVGPVDNRHYPSQPVLLRVNGTALRTKAAGDNPNDPTSWTGEIMTTESRDEDERDQAQKDKDWEQSELWFRTKPAIPFNKYFPMQ
jgi:hypothetical protein